jgi:hypothetical protein
MPILKQSKFGLFLSLLLSFSFLLILWHIDLLLGNDRETDNETTTVARQRPASNNGRTVGSGVFYVVRSEAIPRDRPSAVQLSTVEWSELVGE